jgi:hypothetical protein
MERTVALAAATGPLGARPWRAALDSSPLGGASRVEDTSNRLGQALRKALGLMARQQGRGLTAVAAEAGADLVGGSSLKAALERDWDNPTARDHALGLVLEALHAVERWLDTPPELGAADQRLPASLAVAPQGHDQEVTPTAEGPPTLRQGVAADRRLTVADAARRHGRKSRSWLSDGDNRTGRRDLARGVVPAVGVTPANAGGVSNELTCW